VAIKKIPNLEFKKEPKIIIELFMIINNWKKPFINRELHNEEVAMPYLVPFSQSLMPYMLAVVDFFGDKS